MSMSLSTVDLDALAKQLWAIGDPVRLNILQILPRAPNCEDACNVSSIADQIGLSQPATSHHLRILRQAGLIRHKKMCRDSLYWVQADQAQRVFERLKTVLN
jgi:DNA-binding transcriptional ArsR family regulator